MLTSTSVELLRSSVGEGVTYGVGMNSLLILVCVRSIWARGGGGFTAAEQCCPGIKTSLGYVG